MISGAEAAGSFELARGLEFLMPGRHTPLMVRLLTPDAMMEGRGFLIREQGRSVWLWRWKSHFSVSPALRGIMPVPAVPQGKDLAECGGQMC